MKKTLMLMILDGFGISGEPKGNAINAAHKPNLEKLFSLNPCTKLQASGISVGLPKGQMGNSEVGHTNIGAGRIVFQELTKITKSINDGDFFKNKQIICAMENAKQKNKALHIMGLLSNGGVHSHQEHLYALLKFAKKYNVPKVYIHAFLDGRDTSPNSGIGFLKELEQKIKAIGIGTIATIMGRYWAMDRDNRWERIEKAYDAIIFNKAKKVENFVEYVETCYKNNITDEFIEPFVCVSNSNINIDDSVIFFNFRPDRARQLTHSLVDKNFDKFKRASEDLNLIFVCLTQYEKNMENVLVAFKPQNLNNTFGQYISNKGLTQLRIAETEKYAHVTFFFNGGIEQPYVNEDRILVPSPKVPTYDLKPEMSAPEITEKVINAIKSQKYDVIILNFANCDMVGHTGNLEATIKAVETIDVFTNKIVQAILKIDGTILITADHGNAEKMIDENGQIYTAHTTNAVPFCVIGKTVKLKENGKLCDIAPTMLQLLNLPIPTEMQGKSLIIENK